MGTDLADLFSANEEEIIRMIAYDNPKISIIKLCGVKKKSQGYLRNLN